MPFDAMVVSAAVVAVFVVFAAVLWWADRQTRPDRLQAGSKPAKSSTSEGRRHAA
jgi:cytoskeletal protein RodZ